MRRNLFILPIVAVLFAGALSLTGLEGLAQTSESVDLDAVTRIKEEGFERSAVTANREQMLPRKPLPRPAAAPRPPTSQERN